MADNGRESADGALVSGPLEGLRVLEVAGPLGEYCGKLFADLGAEVILVEPPEGAPRRQDGPFIGGIPGPERSLSFSYLHTSKRGITLNLDTADGRELFRRLADSADVVIESEPVKTMERRGLDYPSLAAARPNLVYTSITPFGSDGPYLDYKATDLSLLALGGLLYLGGYRDGEPIRAAGYQARLAAGQFAAIGTMFAVLDAEESGQGQLVDVSAQECVVMAHETAVQFWDSEKFIRRRAGGTERRAGHGVYPCKDGHIYLLVGMVGQFWGALIDWLEAEGAPEAEEFKDPKWREPDYVSSPEGRALFRERFLNFTMQHTKAELYETGKAARLPICPINTPADLVSFPQLEARDFYTTVEHATLGVPLKMPAAPFKLSETPYRVRQPAPTLGQHNAEVYGELGLTADDLVHLRSAGAI